MGIVFRAKREDAIVQERMTHINGYNKHPSKYWYWIHEDQDFVTYPANFRGGEYGGFVLSAILTFKLANVYMTNLVKCGLNNAKGKFKGLDDFGDEAIKNCFSNFLKKEISILKPKIILALRVYSRAVIPAFWPSRGSTEC